MPKHNILVRETSKFIVEIEAPTEKEAQAIFENNIKDHADKITRVLYTEWMVLQVNEKRIQADHSFDVKIKPNKPVED